MSNIDIVSPMRFSDIVFVWHLRDERQIAWHGRSHSHGEALQEIHYFISGGGSFLNGRKRVAIEAGSLHLTPPGVIHQIIATDAKKPITYYAILFDAEGDGELGDLLARFGPEAGPWNIGTARRFFFADLLERHFSGRDELARSATHQFMSFLYDLAAGTSPARDAADNANVEKALAIMQDAIDRDLDLGELASRVSLSR
ncbi:MAG: AraC family ligand binding domain-containing protein, partial [Spirochaetota bacterium]